ncbi:MAG: hypothetical protein LBV47_05980 [Bacteroidales bacterium]|jgi:hypothetical protein|nr:hypothetical protein [Bacteroidales bacterium]
MSKKSKGFINKPDFRTLIPGYSDSELINILKMRSYYQPEAVNIAVEEAIKRGIINSEQDIFAEEFRVKQLKNTFFPVIENEIQRKKISKSIIRVLIISGVILGMTGLIQFFDNNLAESMLLFAVSITWLVLSVMLFRKVKYSIIRTLLVFVLISIIYTTKILIAKDLLSVIDFFIPIVFYFLVIYGLIFLKKIN